MNSESQRPVRVIVALRVHEPVCGRRLVVSPIGRLVAIAEALEAPIGLALSNETAHLLARDLPQTFRELQRGYAERRVVPIYTPAHQAPVSLSSPAELLDELRLNEECVHGLLGAPPPRTKVVLPAGDEACPAALTLALEEQGFALWMMPPGADRPARLGERLIGVSRVAMELWPERELSAAAVARVVDEASDGALLTFVHSPNDVEAARRAWGELRRHARLAFVAPDELAELERPQSVPPRLRPAIPDVETELPQIAALGALTGVLDWLVDSFGFARTPPLRADVLIEDDYRLDRLPPRAQVPMLLRLAKAGASHGLEVDERLARRPFADAARLCQVLVAESRLADTRPGPADQLNESLLAELDRVPTTILDPRLAFRHAELDRLRAEGCVGAGAASADLDQARVARWRAEAALSSVRAAHASLRRTRFRGRARWRALAQHVHDLAAAVCASLDALAFAALSEPVFEPESVRDATNWPFEASNGM